MTKRFNIYDEYREIFFRLPKVFFTNEKYTKLTNDAKMTWAILQDRLELSQKNNWINKDGDYYFMYTNKNLEKILKRGNTKVNEIKKELETAGLLEQKRRGQGKSNILYLNKPDVTDDDIYAIKENENIGLEVNDSNEVRITDFKTSDIQSSRSTYSEPLEVRNTYTNDTDLNKTDISDTDLNLKQEEEKKIYTESENSHFSKQKQTAFSILGMYLTNKGLKQEDIKNTIKESNKQNVTHFLLEDLKAQYDYMMEKLQGDDAAVHTNFAYYFITGLKMRVDQSELSNKYIEEKQEEENTRLNNKRNTDFYYNWLEE